MRHSIVAAAALTVALATSAAKAQNTTDAKATPKGIVGGALLGGEVVMGVEAALKVKPAWAYVVGGVAGGIGGGVGGYFIEQSTGNGDASRYPMLMLAFGMAFVIPTAIIVLSATAYEPPADYIQDRAPSEEPVPEPPQPSGGPPSIGPAQPSESPPPTTAPPPGSRRLVRSRERIALHRTVAPSALIGIDRGILTLSVPPIELRDVYTKKELFELGLTQKRELRVPVLSLAF